MQEKLCLALATIIICATAQGPPRPPRPNNCKDFKRKYAAGRVAPCPGTGDCGTRTPPTGGSPCCEFSIRGTDNKCWSYYEGTTARRRGGGPSKELREYIQGTFVPNKVDGNKVRDIVKKISEENNVDAKEIGGQNQANKLKSKSRSLLGGLLGGPLLGGLGGLLGGSLYPECPVHVKLCHRVQCGGYYANNNPQRCLSDPRCCYDYKISFLRSIFGPGYLGDAPACYYGPTSRQWIYITNFFRPWNPFYTSFILDAFEDLFNTNAFNIAGKFLCDIDFGRKAYPVGSKSELQCNLVSGCWDDSLPKGSRCLMASEQIQRLFGQQEVYPSLFTDDPSDTQCSNNWFEFGPKAYKRLACGVGLPPPDLFDLLYNWCPIADCCLNYLALSKEHKSSLSALSFLGGGGGGGIPGLFTGSSNFNPLNSLGFGGISGLGGTTPFNPALLSYLFGGSSISDDLEDLFCPYRAISFSSIFPDMSDETEGCCDIPTCYHKKKLVGGPRYPPPPTPGPPATPPPPPPPQPVPRWGPFGPCSTTCGPGTKTRTCFYGNQPQPPHVCGGSPTESCQGSPCIRPYAWSGYGPCSATCGQGTRSRQCRSGPNLADPRNCVGPANELCQMAPCPTPPPPSWGTFRPDGPCPVTCGTGTITYTRPCLSGGQQVSANQCPGGFSASRRTETCSRPPCGPSYQWSNQLFIRRPCSVTCGRGEQGVGPRCQDNRGQYVDDRFCPGIPRIESRPCNRQACPQNAIWSRWTKIPGCGATCGNQGLQQEQRSCLFEDGRPAPQQLCPPGETTRLVPCPMPPCGVDPHYYTRWVDGNCVRSPSGGCEKVDTRSCYRSDGGSYDLVPNGQGCAPIQRTTPCSPPC